MIQLRSNYLTETYKDIISAGDSVVVPDPAIVGPTAVADIKGIFNSPPHDTPTGKMPDGPVTGNGDLGLTLGGQPDQLRFYLGKTDFFGVLNGRVIAVFTIHPTFLPCHSLAGTE